MAKLSKNQLKTLVKECLVEILVEGISPSDGSMLREAARTPKKSSPPITHEMREKMRQQLAPDTAKTEKFDRAVTSATEALTSDPILQGILAETARTTYQQQLGADGPGSSAMSVVGGMPVNGSRTPDPAQVFGQEAASKWADLAFAQPKSQGPLKPQGG